MTDLVRFGGVEGTLRVPVMRKRDALAKLKEMKDRGEIAYAYNPRQEWNIATGEREWVVDYVRLTDPPARAPRYVAITAAALGAVASVGALAWHARYVLLALLLAVCVVAAVGTVARSFMRKNQHCPGVWHR